MVCVCVTSGRVELGQRVNLSGMFTKSFTVREGKVLHPSGRSADWKLGARPFL